MKIKALFFILFFTATLFTSSLQATPLDLKTFGKGSYQWILNHYKNKPFMLVIWSTSCSSCLKEMSLISTLNKQYPELNLIMLSVDDNSVRDEINEILSKHQLKNLDNWVFAEDNSAKLRFEIDSSWYGELPRTYFFDKNHQRTGLSGVILEEKYTENIRQLLTP